MVFPSIHGYVDEKNWMEMIQESSPINSSAKGSTHFCLKRRKTKISSSKIVHTSWDPNECTSLNGCMISIYKSMCPMQFLYGFGYPISLFTVGAMTP
jgi:hypothetical protein